MGFISRYLIKHYEIQLYHLTVLTVTIWI